MNGKSWCTMGMIATFIATSILIAEFMFPWIVILGFTAYTIFVFLMINCIEHEYVKDYENEIEAYEQAIETYKNALNNSKNETITLAQKHKELKNDFKKLSLETTKLQEEYKELSDRYGQLDKMRELNIQHEVKKTKKTKK